MPVGQSFISTVGVRVHLSKVQAKFGFQLQLLQSAVIAGDSVHWLRDPEHSGRQVHGAPFLFIDDTVNPPGANYNLPSNFIWYPETIQLKLVTDANPSWRSVVILLTDGTNSIPVGISSNQASPSSEMFYTFAVGMADTADAFPTPHVAGVLARFSMSAGQSIQVDVADAGAGDQITEFRVIGRCLFNPGF